MLKINYSPVRMDVDPLEVNWVDPVVTINGNVFDLSELPDGATAEHEVLKTVARTGTDYEVTLILPHGSNAPEATRFPESIEITENGVVAVPIYNEVN